jgi:glycosyltransferase involved in cell wall biosynthesis
VRFDPAGREQFRAAHGLRDKFVVMYSGNHSPVHPLDTLMQAAERLKDDQSITFCFIGGGSEFKRVQRWALVENAEKLKTETLKVDGKNELQPSPFQMSGFQLSAFQNVLCLPYQPLAQLSGSLSAADAHVVVMGDAMPGLVHPCKIYNILAVGAPVIYIGPKPSHVTEVLDQTGGDYRAIRVAHGAVDILAEQIQDLRQKTAGERRSLPMEVTAAFSKAVLLPELIAALEKLRDD